MRFANRAHIWHDRLFDCQSVPRHPPFLLFDQHGRFLHVSRHRSSSPRRAVRLLRQAWLLEAQCCRVYHTRRSTCRCIDFCGEPAAADDSTLLAPFCSPIRSRPLIHFDENACTRRWQIHHRPRMCPTFPSTTSNSVPPTYAALAAGWRPPRRVVQPFELSFCICNVIQQL